MKFFIDTADVGYISKLWTTRLAPHMIPPSAVAGITTNPNAMAKVNVHTLSEFETRVRDLCDLLSDIRGDSKGLVYVQMPFDDMSDREIYLWVRYIRDIAPRTSRVALKCPPYFRILRIMTSFPNYEEFHLNVTGIADAQLALWCLVNFDVSYVSIIPGRMEEVGINADDHLRLLNTPSVNGSVITGSMRTLAGLQRAIQYRTIPTIGSRVWDLMDSAYLSALSEQWVSQLPPFQGLPPVVSDVNRKLSTSFFSQMNECGRLLYQNFTDLIE